MLVVNIDKLLRADSPTDCGDADDHWKRPAYESRIKGSHSRFDFLGPSGLNNPHSYDIAEYPNTGSDRPNLVGRVGYNTNLAAGDHAFYMTTESYNHPTSNGQLEWYLEYFSPRPDVLSAADRRHDSSEW